MLLVIHASQSTLTDLSIELGPGVCSINSSPVYLDGQIHRLISLWSCFLVLLLLHSSQSTFPDEVMQLATPWSKT